MTLPVQKQTLLDDMEFAGSSVLYSTCCTPFCSGGSAGAQKARWTSVCLSLTHRMSAVLAPLVD
jgi:hypothetical protein